MILISLSILVATLGSTGCLTSNIRSDHGGKLDTVVELPNSEPGPPQLEDGTQLFTDTWNDKIAATLAIRWGDNKPYTYSEFSRGLVIWGKIENISEYPQEYTRWAASDPLIYLWLIGPENQRFALHSDSTGQSMLPVVTVEELQPQETIVEESGFREKWGKPGVYELRMEFFPGKETAIPDKPEIVLSTTIELID